MRVTETEPVTPAAADTASGADIGANTGTDIGASPRCAACGRELPFDGKKPAGPGQSVRCPNPHCGVVLEHTAAGEYRVGTFRLSRGDEDGGSVAGSNYTLCVLPFLLDDAERDDPFAAMDRSARWLRKRFSLKRHEDVERTDYFLPYIRRFLFPSLFEGRPADDSPDTCRHYHFPLNLLDGRGTKWVDYRVHCCDSHKNVEQTFSVVLDNVELILFNYRVGFLVLRFRCTDPEATFFDQMRAANLLRFITPPHAEFQMPTLEGPAGRYKVPQLVAWLLDEFRRDGRPSANRPALQPDDGRVPARLIYDDRMLVYTFTCLDKETVLDDAQQNHILLRRSVVVRFDDQTQATGRARTPDGTDTDWRRKRWESYSKDGGGLVVFDTDKYHREAIGTYWETYYFDIFLLAVLQRVTLLALFERMADISRLTGGHGSRERLRHIRYDYLVFKNQCCFSQITNRERGLELWRKWQEVFETGTLLAEVNEQSDELDDFLRIRAREQNQKLLQLGGLVTTLAPVIWALDVILGDRPWIGPLRWGLLLGLFVTAGLTALYILRRGRREV